MFSFPIPSSASNLPNETPKPRKTGTYIKQTIPPLTPDEPMTISPWFYSAKPEFYRQSPQDTEYFLFHQNPPNIAP